MGEKVVLGISYGIIAPTIEEQLKEQGFTLGEDENNNKQTRAAYVQKMRERVNDLRMSGFLVESEANKVNNRMQKYIMKHLTTITPVANNKENTM